jgi:hypothetical protein
MKNEIPKLFNRNIPLQEILNISKPQALISENINIELLFNNIPKLMIMLILNSIP